MRTNRIALVALLAWSPMVLGDSTGITSPSVGAGSNIGGSCTTTNPDLLTPANLNSMNNALNDAIKKVGKALNATQNQQMQAQVSQMNQALQQQIQTEKELYAADEKQKYLNDTTGFAAINTCEQSAAAQSAMNGLAAANQAKDAYMKDAQKRQAPVSNPVTSMRNLAAAPRAEYDAVSLMGAGSTPADPSAVAAYLSNLVTPMPAQSMTDAEKLTPAGKRTQAIQNLTAARQSLPTETLSYIAAQQTPVIDASYANQQWQVFNQGPAPGAANGKISPNGLLDVLTNSRYASQQFYQQVTFNPSEAWQIKQYAMMLAVQLRIGQEQLALLERTASIQAASLAAAQSGQAAQMNSLRGAAMSQTLK